MIGRYYIKIVGGNVNNIADGGNISVELPITGINPSYIQEGEKIVSWTGTASMIPIYRRKWKVNFESFSTYVPSGDINTDDVADLLAVLNKRYIWLIKPTTGGRVMPPRWNAALTDTAAIFTSGVKVVHTESVELGDYNKAGREALSLTFEDCGVV